MNILTTLNGMTPLGVIALLCYIIYLQISNKKAVRQVSFNHLSGLPDMASDITKLVQMMEARQGMAADISKLVTMAEAESQIQLTMNNNLIYLIAKANGSSNQQPSGR